jgi:hypothetical protein
VLSNTITYVLPLRREMEIYVCELRWNCFPISVCTSPYFSSARCILTLVALNLHHSHATARLMLPFVLRWLGDNRISSRERRDTEQITWVHHPLRIYEYSSPSIGPP